MCAAISPNMDVANALLPVYVTTQLFFGGFILDFRVRRALKSRLPPSLTRAAR